jgi:hypothetical protein
MGRHHRTFGPWYVDRSQRGDLEPYGPDGIHLLSSEVADARPLAEREANALLIAAAPELLAAAQDVYHGIRSPKHESVCTSGTCRPCRLKRAIAKAQGRGRRS